MQHYAFDFDGVLCDSARETGVSAWRAGCRIWDDWRGPEPPDWLLADFVVLRPFLETGYQAILLMRMAYRGLDAAAIGTRFAALCGDEMCRTGVTIEELVGLFAEARDRWIRTDLADWLSRHRFYPGALEVLRACAERYPTTILTTKQERFVHALLAHGGCRLADDAVFGLDRGRPKEHLLLALPAASEDRLTVRFVEDRLNTLLRVAASPALECVRLYYADWGYGLPADLEAARAHERITVLDSETFAAWPLSTDD